MNIMIPNMDATIQNEDGGGSLGGGYVDMESRAGRRRLDEPGDATDDGTDDADANDDASAILDGNKSKNGGGAEEHAIVQCTTTAGPIKMHFHRSWSPNGYDRASTLFERGYYDQSHFFRVVPHFLVQFGISYTNDQELKHLANSNIKDDPKQQNLMPFREGYMSFAGSGPNSRTSQLFIAYDRAGGLGNSPWETPFGEVVEGLQNVQNLYKEYGDMPPWGKGPEQGPIRNQGSKYIEENFPLLDKFEKCTVRRVASLQQQENDENGDKKLSAKEEMQAVEDSSRRELRGSDMTIKLSGSDRRVKMSANNQAPKGLSGLKEDSGTADASIPVLGKVAIFAVVISLALFLVQKKQKKKMGKSV